MEWLLCVSDYIVELIPSSQTFPDGRKLEVMTCRPRSDIFINLPALRTLDNMLLDILDGFKETEFWYVDEGIVASDSTDGSASFRKTIHRQPEKWWLPVPRVPAGGLSENSRKQMNHTRNVLPDIEGRHGHQQRFAVRYGSPRVVFGHASQARESLSGRRHLPEGDAGGESRETAALLEATVPGLSQTILDVSKIQFNKDVGKSIVESYSRVLESLAFNIVARIDDILYVDDLTRHTDKLLQSPAVNHIAQRKSCFPYSVPVSGTPYRSSSSAFSTPGFSPAPSSLISPARGDRTPFILNNAKPPRRGFGVRRVLNNYLGVEPRPKLSSTSMESISSSITSSDGSDHHSGSKTVAK
ncbi:hypothetical protein MLD38_008716 [Melastoma candidum]|uniref:Uncharacterized protein n=1 Tax=Melastoma candidum TaxID=119954 RepID=A0ACB9RWI9_9MYRT|nr:hypothetical protein MLD38_008716 [Melastoma candidum]